jgi:putative flippase GtrA
LAILPLPVHFGLVGAASTSIDVAVYWLLTALAHAAPLPANALSYSLAAINSFLLNKLITFRCIETQSSLILQLSTFAIVRLLCLGISTLVLALSLLLVASLAAKLVSVAVTFFFAYTLSSQLVYR